MRAMLAAALLLAAPALASHAPWASVAGADVVLVNFHFAPAVVVAHRGETITWLALQNDKELPHTITSDDGAPSPLGDPADGATFDLRTADGDLQGWTVPADAAAGVLPYYCRPHAPLGMRGFVVVLP
jgi:plastocyanin